jgi:glycine/D-amino acid oxidase-like deaminating enzyme
MTTPTTFDVLIAGSGPIGAATAFLLTRDQPSLRVGLITQDPTTDPSATYLQAGGCLRWHWDDAVKEEMTKTTADVIKDLAASGVDLDLIEDHYLLLHTGTYTPSINFSGRKLVEYLLAQAKERGLELIQAKVENVQVTDAATTITAGDSTYAAPKAVLALGVANANYLPDYELETEKRQLFVLDLPVDDTRQEFPHVIAPVGKGYAFAFIKKMPQGLRLLVGQEDVVEANEDAAAENYFGALLDAGLGNIMPFLQDAQVEHILWGFDAGNKELRLEQRGSVLAANCGSAARSCIWIGQQVVNKLQH